jgi:hypothetical protein
MQCWAVVSYAERGYQKKGIAPVSGKGHTLFHQSARELLSTYRKFVEDGYFDAFLYASM